ncbi:MAG: efflux RND transporter periplasmic adaptor subunit [Shinella sp.]|nr:efflux RND transporter periplasmic adaptor subunit [Shinella sp.]
MKASLLAVAVFAAVFLSGCKEEEQAELPPRPVLSAIIVPQALPGTRFAGTVQPKVQASLGSRVPGRLVARSVGVGDLVEKGEVLATLEATSYELAVRSAKAELSSAEATLAGAITAEERQKALRQTNTAAQASVESAEQTREAASASLTRARTALAKAEEQLSYTRILSEFDGVVTATGAEVGQVVSTGEAIVTVARPDERDAVVDIPETAAGIVMGSRFNVVLQINPEIMVKGTVREIAPAADPTTRTRRVKIALESPPDTFRLGTTITAELEGPATMALMVPASAVLERDGKSHLWIVDEQKGEVRMHEVKTRGVGGQLVQVVEGIAGGERVVTAGVRSLKDGQKIKVENGARS